MPFSNPTKNEQGHWVVNFTQDGAQASKTLATQQKYLDGNIILNAAAASTTVTYGSEPATGKTAASYTDISSTAPVLVSGGYLYINTGYTGDTKISLAKLVPEGSDVKGHAEYILSGHSAYDNDGVLVAGSIPINTMTTFSTNSPTIDFVTTITTHDASAYHASDTGAAKNYNSTSGLDHYVTINATSSGTIAQGTVSTTMQVAGEYMANDVTVNISNATAGSGGTDENYIKASLGGAVTLTPVTNIADATAGASIELTAGEEYFLASGTNDFAVEFTATATADATANSSDSTTTTLSVRDTYMLSDIVVGSKGGAQATDSDQDTADIIKYLKAGTYSVSMTGSAMVTPSATTNMATISRPSSGTEGTDYFSITPSGSLVNTITGSAVINTSGWIPQGSTDGVAGNVSVASATKLYVAKASLSASGSITVSGSGTLQPGGVSIAKQTKPSGDTWTDAASGDATSTTPTSGVYIAVKGTSEAVSATNVSVNGSGTGTARVSTAGYAPDTLTGTGTISASGNARVSVSAKEGISYYIPITSGRATPAITVADSQEALSGTTSIGKQYFKVTPTATVNTEGWISSINNGTIRNCRVNDAVYSSSFDITNIDDGYTPPRITNQTFSVTPKTTITTAGWIGSDSTGSAINYKVRDGSASVTATNIPVSTTLSRTTDTSTNQIVIEAVTTGSATVGGTVTTAGWISSISSASIGVIDGGAEYRIDIYNGAIA